MSHCRCRASIRIKDASNYKAMTRSECGWHADDSITTTLMSNESFEMG